MHSNELNYVQMNRCAWLVLIL